MNLFEQGLLNEPLGLLMALLIGLLFGFWLERAGFGSSRKLTAIFYFEDFTVLKVMFSAMVTAAAGLWLLSALGLCDLGAMFVPETVIWPQLAGGLVFGAGFVIGGWCPGTAAVGVASGRLDALVFLLGAGAGSLLFAAAQPALAAFLQAGASGVSPLPRQLGIPDGAGVLGLLAIAMLAFTGATALEQRRRRLT